MLRTKKRTLEELIFDLFIFTMPLLPEYFRIGGYPIIVFTSILPFVVIVGLRHKVYLPGAHKSFLIIIFALSCIVYGAHGEVSSLLRYSLAVVLTLIILLNHITNERKQYDAFCVLASAGTLMAVFGLIEKFIGFNVFSLVETVNMGKTGSVAAVRNGVVRVELSFGTAIVAGLYMIFINAVVFYLLNHRWTKRKQKPMLVFTYIMTFIITYWTDSRMCMMTILFMQILFLMKGRWNKKLSIFIGIAFLFAFDFAINGILIQFIGKYIKLVSEIASSGLSTSDITTAYRFNLFPTLLPMIGRRLLLGYGSDYMNNYTFSIWGHTYYSIDNMFLDVPMRHGIIGLALVLIPIIYGIKNSVYMTKSGDQGGYYFYCLFLIYLVNLISVTQ